MHYEYIDGLVQERRNSITNTLELRLSCTDPPIYKNHSNNKAIHSVKNKVTGVQFNMLIMLNFVLTWTDRMWS